MAIKRKYTGRYSKLPTSTKQQKKKSYGAMTRKDREFVAEYGQLQEDALSIASDEDQSSQQQQQNSAHNRRIFKEEELDAASQSIQKRRPDSGDEDSDEDDFSSKPSAYELLVSSLQKNSSHSSMWKQLKAEEQGLDEADDINDQSSVSDEGSEDENDIEDSDIQNESDGTSQDEFGFAQDESCGSEMNDLDGTHLDDKEDSDEAEVKDFSQLEDDQIDIFHLTEQECKQLEQKEEEISHKKIQSHQFTDDDWTVSVQQLQSSKRDLEKEVFYNSKLMKFKNRLETAWMDANTMSEMEVSDMQRKLANIMLSHHDLLFGCRNENNAQDIMRIYAMHCLNHVFKTRDNVIKNNEKIKKVQETGTDVEVRDQGFTRPKVLVLLPMRNMAYRFIQNLIQLSACTQQENKKRFVDEFGSEEDDVNQRKPKDYQNVFWGNIDDCFRIGVKFSRKAMKLYTEFYSSDIIVASPLGLRMIIGSSGDKKRDFDFLSSIEVVVIDQANLQLMQNWDHVRHIFEHLNLFPKEMRDCDFSRVRPWYLDGRAKLLRQTLIFSDFVTPEINTLFSNCTNVNGRFKIRESYAGSLCDVIPKVQHIYTRLNATLTTADDTRFQFFVEKTIPALRASVSLQSHTCIFIPSYFDFLRVRNWMDKNEIPYGDVNEYSSQADATRSRSDFFKGETPFLLITERAHFFRRYRIRGIKNLVFYGLPDNAQFYSEYFNMMIPEDISDVGDSVTSLEMGSTVTVLFTKYDALKLERVVGTKRVSRLISGTKSTFMFA